MAEQTMNRTLAQGVPSRWEKTEDGFLRCTARIMREGVMPYARDEIESPIPDDILSDPVMMLASMDSLGSAESLRSLEGALVVVGDHKWITPENSSTDPHGHVAGSPRVNGPFVEVDLIVTDPLAITSIELGQYPEISAAYHSTTLWEHGELDGQHYDGKQVQIRYNHIAVIEQGTGRAGTDVRILNQKGAKKMPVRMKLYNSGRFINVADEDVQNVEEENNCAVKNEAAESDTKNKLEDVMNQLEEKNGMLSSLQAEVEDLKGQLKVYQDKINELLSDEAQEAKAFEMLDDQHQGGEILENEMPDDEEREKAQNSLKGIYGQKLYKAVLGAVGVNVEGMSNEAVRGAFKAQYQISSKRGPRAVAGTSMTRMKSQNTAGSARKERTPLERLGIFTK